MLFCSLWLWVPTDAGTPVCSPVPREFLTQAKTNTVKEMVFSVAWTCVAEQPKRSNGIMLLEWGEGGEGRKGWAMLNWLNLTDWLLSKATTSILFCISFNWYNNTESNGRIWSTSSIKSHKHHLDSCDNLPWLLQPCVYKHFEPLKKNRRTYIEKHI